MEKLQLSNSCKKLKHIECDDCMCNCHLPGYYGKPRKKNIDVR